MLSPRGAHDADRLAAMLDAGTLPDLGPVPLTHGTIPTLALAVKLALGKVGHLGYLDAGNPDIRERRRVAEADIAWLWHLVTASSPARRQTP